MPQRLKQLNFTGKGLTKPNDAFGGSLLTSNPKTKRPLDSKLPILLTLKARRSVLRLPKTFGLVHQIVDRTAKKHGVIIYRLANVGNHLHLVIKLPRLGAWAAFIRELSGRLAQVVNSVLTGKALGSGPGGFWRFRPHTRIVRGWRKPFKTVLAYMDLNTLEADGFISRRETRTLRDLRLIWADG